MKKVSHFVSCPFNPKHQVLEVRLLYHIYKCPDIVSPLVHYLARTLED